MHKILLAIFLCLFFINTAAEAEFICIKNTQKIKVNTNNRVNVRLPKIMKTGTATCPNGYTKLITVPEVSKTMKGVWSFAASEAQPYAETNISFPRSLTTIPSSTIFVQNFVSDPICTGSFSNPTAPIGILCIYERSSFNLNEDFSQRYQIVNPTESSVVNNASVLGVIITAAKGTLPTNYHANGTWAYTEQ